MRSADIEEGATYLNSGGLRRTVLAISCDEKMDLRVVYRVGMSAKRKQCLLRTFALWADRRQLVAPNSGKPKGRRDGHTNHQGR